MSNADNVESQESVQGAMPNAGSEVAASGLPDASSSEKTSEPSDTNSSTTPTPVQDSGTPIASSVNDAANSAPKRRGRPPGSGKAKLDSVTQAPARPPAPVAVTTAQNIDSTQAALLASNMWFNCGELIFGEDWQPVVKEATETHPAVSEPQMVFRAFKNYFQSIGVSTIPPVWELVAVLGTYTAARITKPTVKSRLTGAMIWIKEKVKFKR